MSNEQVAPPGGASPTQWDGAGSTPAPALPPLPHVREISGEYWTFERGRLRPATEAEAGLRQHLDQIAAGRARLEGWACRLLRELNEHYGPLSLGPTDLMRRDVIADMRRIVESYGQDNRHIIVLDDYEVANLRAALQACGYALFDKGPDGQHQLSPLDVLHTGDWLGQVWQKLPYVEDRIKPNRDSIELRRQAREWKP